MISNKIHVALAVALAAAVMTASCSKKEEAEAPVVVEKKVARVKAPPPRSAAPAVVNPEPFALTVPPPSGPPEELVKEALPTAGPVANDQEAWQAGQAAFEYYAQTNGFSKEATKSFFLKHIANNGDHFRLMMFGVLPGGPRYIAVKVYRDGRTEVLPDEM